MSDVFDTDVLIVGGDPSETSAAISLLQDSSLKVIQTDHTAFDISLVGEHVDSSLFDLLNYLKIEKEYFEGKNLRSCHS